MLQAVSQVISALGDLLKSLGGLLTNGLS